MLEVKPHFLAPFPGQSLVLCGFDLTNFVYTNCRHKELLYFFLYLFGHFFWTFETFENLRFVGTCQINRADFVKLMGLFLASQTGILNHMTSEIDLVILTFLVFVQMLFRSSFHCHSNQGVPNR